MPELIAIPLIWVVAAYAAGGVVFGVLFLARGVDRLDPVARGAGVGFRLIILPGVAAFWPLLLARWLTGPRARREERNPHRDSARRAAGGGS